MLGKAGPGARQLLLPTCSKWVSAPAPWRVIAIVASGEDDTKLTCVFAGTLVTQLRLVDIISSDPSHRWPFQNMALDAPISAWSQSLARIRRCTIAYHRQTIVIGLNWARRSVQRGSRGDSNTGSAKPNTTCVTTGARHTVNIEIHSSKRMEEDW